MSKRQNFMLSPHFSYEEMTRSKWAEDNGVDNTPDELQLAGLINICWKLGEPLREVFGPVTVTSGFRQGTMWIHCSVCLDPKENRHQAIKNYKSYK